jgi:hypothetical protein
MGAPRVAIWVVDFKEVNTINRNGERKSAKTIIEKVVTKNGANAFFNIFTLLY